MKLKTYKVTYFFEGKGVAIVQATSKADAVEVWERGDEITAEEETGDFQLDLVEEVK